MKMEKVVVTGAAGFIGSHLCRKLIEDGVTTVIGIDSLRSGDWARTPIEVVRDERDISDICLDEWMEILSNTDALFHLAAEKYNSSKSTPEKVLFANIVATERLVRAAALVGVRRTVFTSSLYAYGSMGPAIMDECDVPTPTTLYGASKVMGEGIFRAIDREIGLSWNIARLFFIYGPRQFAEGGYKSVILSNFERLMNGEPPTIYGDGTQALDYVYIDDCIQGLISLASQPTEKQIVNISTGIPITINDLTQTMLNIANVDKLPIHMPADWTNGSIRFGSTTLAGERFEWNATTSLEEGLSRVFEWKLEEQS